MTGDGGRKMSTQVLHRKPQREQQSLEAKKEGQGFFLEKLKELLPKALRIYEKTSDKGLEALLKQTEQWV